MIHRDLKPANIMVGAFGEVQVMDWRLGQKDEAQPWYDKSLAWHTANEAAVKADTDLQGFFPEAAALMTPIEANMADE